MSWVSAYVSGGLIEAVFLTLEFGHELCCVHVGLFVCLSGDVEETVHAGLACTISMCCSVVLVMRDYPDTVDPLVPEVKRLGLISHMFIESGLNHVFDGTMARWSADLDCRQLDLESADGRRLL
jgi:hypothetical protein